MADQKLILNINLGEIQYMEASSRHYWLKIRVHNSEIPNNESNMADENNFKKIFGWNSVHRGFRWCWN